MSFDFKEIVEAISNIDKTLGFKKFVKYLFLFAICLAILNYKTVIKDTIEIINEISENIHSEKMEKRDQLLAELKPLLTEMRSSMRADRILYLEYHNSKENLLGIPFKYVELVQQSNGFAIPPIDASKYQDINIGMITSIYEDIKLGNIIHCKGPNDSIFRERYSGIYELINSRDNSKEHIYISIPGISQPVGLIILEWMVDGNNIDMEEVIKTATHNYIPRINALILSKSPEKRKWI